MSTLKLWLVRHGQTAINAGIWSPKPAETTLTELGKEQARLLAEEVKMQPDLIIVSPLVRAQATAEFILKKWPQTPHKIQPIQELIYLSPTRLSQLDPEERKKEIDLYWQKADPYYLDGADAESFASFLTRISNFHTEILNQQGFIVVVGHGQFFKAYQLGLTYGFELTYEWMSRYREQESTHAMKNGEIFKFEFN